MVQQERQFPPPNVVLERRRISQEMSNHKKRLQNARPAIDTRSPPLYLHLHVKLKKLQIECDRRNEIHSENMRLLDRMNRIMERNPPYEDSLRNRDRKSLNFQKSREEQHRIMQENHRLLQKLLRTESDCYKEKRPRSCKTAVTSGKSSRNSSHINKKGGSGNSRNKLPMTTNGQELLSRNVVRSAAGDDITHIARDSSKKPELPGRRQDLQKISLELNSLNIFQDRAKGGQPIFWNAEIKRQEISCQHSIVQPETKQQQSKQKTGPQIHKKKIRTS